ncbi:hypothetical protein BO86DRAFT_429824 [Aspergillus japonicus CBS 114.51]|uniref:Uncharacterized protein n=2 Tax=Aspergillus TaxID=5052 RepID=A0A2V5H3V5_ASPV1|nr:hypothetical protein BO86DRAFT_429824 [Aspergillus japonicus CBS 114.51]PYI18695.1 hypothetical protein BO99DRAFT_422913 [Aspergillus violaceofuscus CBS 115571]RAH82121.1 hypothetical protein BO86DRAFT_429824 [Aspergillus japonicus CBS 114.51]
MRFQLSELDPKSDALSEFVTCQVTRFGEPSQPIYRFFYPIFGGEPEAQKQEALTNLMQLHREWAREDPDSVFLQIRDRDRDNQLVAGVYSKVHRQKPHVYELGLDSWLEAAIAMGVTIYRRHGLLRQKWRPRMQPLRYWPMWRPPHGKIELGNTSPPWGELSTNRRFLGRL